MNVFLKILFSSTANLVVTLLEHQTIVALVDPNLLRLTCTFKDIYAHVALQIKVQPFF
jgi:hypothetical protein